MSKSINWQNRGISLLVDKSSEMIVRVSPTDILRIILRNIIIGSGQIKPLTSNQWSVRVKRLETLICLPHLATVAAQPQSEYAQ